MIDYEILKAIWWLFIGVLLVGFTIMDGQDMGVGTLLPFLGKNDSERRIMINSVAPHWRKSPSRRRSRSCSHPQSCEQISPVPIHS